MKRKRGPDVPYPWKWTEGKVDPKKEHIELRYGNALKGGWNKETIKELDFYFIALEEPDPWEYAIYHCGTMSNAYSSVHWSYFPKATTRSSVRRQIIKGVDSKG